MGDYFFMDCIVCCNIFNKTTRKPVTCSCGFVACHECTKRYLTSTADDPHCMSCKGAWDRRFLVENLSRHFVDGQHKTHRCNVLVERERSMMPATMPLVERERKARDLEDARDDLESKAKEMFRMASNLQHQAGFVHREAQLARRGESSSHNKRVLHKCQHYGCRGFVDENWHCGACNRDTCNHCLEPKIDDHKCDPDTVKTVRALRSDSRTKPCPNCGSHIYKVDGCDQMWCTECHTAFSWTSGEVVNGQIHNPHYTEYIARGGGVAGPRNPLDEQCGGIPHLLTVRDAAPDLLDVGTKHFILDMHRFVTHVTHVEIPRHNIGVNAVDTRDLRVSFMIGDISEETWMRELHKREKMISKSRDFLNAWMLLRDVMTDLFRAYVHTRCVKDLLNESERLRDYVNTCFKSISYRYKSVTREISYDWRII